MTRRSPFRVLFLLLIIVGALAFVRGWLTMSREPDPSSRKVNVKFTADPEKVMEDAGRVREAADALTDKVSQDADQLGETIREKIGTPAGDAGHVVEPQRTRQPEAPRP